jgi:tRNA-dihydrouridine synthase
LQAARDGVGGKIPVSVKTRIGYNKVDLEWIKTLLLLRTPELPALPGLTVHLRTRKEMSDVPAHWEIMPPIVQMRDKIQNDLAPSMRTLIIGNGDVVSIADARIMAKNTGCDGVMIGRGIFGKPWFFGKAYEKPKDRLKIMLEHATLFEKLFGGKGKSKSKSKGKGNHGRIKNFAVMKKHFKAYVSGWDGAKELRVQLMNAETLAEVKVLVKKHLAENKL